MLEALQTELVVMEAMVPQLGGTEEEALTLTLTPTLTPTPTLTLTLTLTTAPDQVPRRRLRGCRLRHSTRCYDLGSSRSSCGWARSIAPRRSAPCSAAKCGDLGGKSRPLRMGLT